jgi:hypothetical protein
MLCSLASPLLFLLLFLLLLPLKHSQLLLLKPPYLSPIHAGPPSKIKLKYSRRLKGKRQKVEPLIPFALLIYRWEVGKSFHAVPGIVWGSWGYSETVDV